MKNFEIFVILILTIILFLKAIFGKLLVMTDAITDGIYLYEFIRNEILRGNFPFWNPYIFYGMPTIGTLQFGLYPFFIFLIILPAKFFLNYWVIFHFIISYIGMFLLVNRILNDKKIALFSAISYSLSGIFFGYIYSGHLGKFAIYSLLPFYFIYLREIFINPNLKNALILALFTSLISLNAHVQMLYYLILFTLIYSIYELFFIFKENNKKAFKIIFLGLFVILISTIIFLGQFLPIYDYTINYSQRGLKEDDYQFAITWSLGWQDYISTFIGGFSGFSIESPYAHYWGPNPFKINSEYFGIVIFLILTLSFLNKLENRLRNILIFNFILFSIISLGGSTFIYKFIWSILPFYQKFRSPSMAFYICIFSAILISAITLKNIKENPKAYLKFLFFVPIILFIFWLFSSDSLINSIFNNPIEQSQIVSAEFDKIRFSIFLAFLFSFLSSLLIYSYIKNWLSFNFLIISLAFLSAFDLYLISKNFIQYVEDDRNIFEDDGIIKFLKENKGYYVVFPFYYRTDENYFSLKKIETIGGHHGVQPYRLFSLIGAEGRLMLNPATTTELLKNPKLGDILSIKYVITQKLPKETNDPIISLFYNYVKDYKKVYDDGFYEIYENPNYYHKFYLVNSYKISKNPIIDVRNFENKLVFENEPDEKIDHNEEIRANVEILKFSENYVKLKVVLENPSYLVFSENYHHQWKAYVNGKEKKVYRVNWTQMAIALNKGDYIVEFVYKPSLELLSLTLYILGFIILGLSFILFRFKK
jgi:hypothetical protein